MNSPSIEQLENAKNILEEVQELDDTMFSYNPAYMYALKIALKSINMLQKYMKIGTLSDVKNWSEKQKDKKVSNRKVLFDFHNRPYAIRGDCPICGCEDMKSTNTDYCVCCGQKLNWGDV